MRDLGGTALYLNDNPRGITPILNPYRDFMDQVGVLNCFNWCKSQAKTTVKSTMAEVAKSVSRKPWQITRENTERVMRHPGFGKFYKSKNARDWITMDNAGHAGSKFKRYHEEKGTLVWQADLDEFGSDVIGKHKEGVG